MKKIHYILSVLMMGAMLASCSQELEMEESTGYLALNIQSYVSTNTPGAGTRAAVPSDYDAKQLCVEIIAEGGAVVKSTDDFDNDTEFQGNMVLPVGKYTVVAHSAGWDGSGSGFDAPYYYGSATVTVQPSSLKTLKIVCTQANVKLTVNYDQSFANNFKRATTTVTSSLSDVAPLAFVMGTTTKSGYIPAGNFDLKLDVTNHSDINNSLTRSFTDVQPRDHYIINFRLQDEGSLGNGTGPGLTVEVDESTNTYTYTIQIPRKSSTSVVARQANAWSTFAYLSGAVTGKTGSFNTAGLAMQWRRVGDTDWNTLENSALTVDADDNITATVKGLAPSTAYEYRVYYTDGETDVTSDVVAFTTEAQTPLYNGGFEHWYMSGKIAYPCETGVSYWDTSNAGAATVGSSITTSTTEKVHGGTYAARLESKWMLIKFAAASMYTGQFIELVGTSGAKLKWGVPFTARPTALTGFMHYQPVTVDRANNSAPASAPAKGEMDQCGMYVALLTEQLNVDNTDMSTFPDWKTDPRVVAYGELPLAKNVATSDWTEVNIPLVYNSLTKKPTHLLVLFSSSKYGDYFHGGAGSTLFVDDFSFVYGDSPAVQ